MRRPFLSLLVPLGLMMGVACATGVETTAESEDDDATSGTGSGGTTNGPGSGGAPQTTTTVASGGDTTNVGGMTTTTTTATTTTATSAASTTATTTATSSSAVTTTTTGGGGNCNPLSPGTVCGAGMHCIPQTNGTPICQGPTGSGTQYASCTTSDTCAPIYECVFTGSFNWCMQWCTSDFDCPGYPTDLCYALNPAVYVGAQEWGVCYDGLP